MDGTYDEKLRVRWIRVYARKPGRLRKIFSVNGALFVIKLLGVMAFFGVMINLKISLDAPDSWVELSPSDSAKPRRPPAGKKIWYASAKGAECSNVRRYHGEIPLPTVALLSMHGSGNTWMRWLLERLTGYCTGSVYAELALRKAGFQCEMLPLNSGVAVVYKTHYFHHVNSSKVLLLVRNPFDAMISDYNRINTAGNHTSLADEQAFYTPDWHRFVAERSWEWLDQIMTALQKSEELHVTFYENLRTNLSMELNTVAYFLGFRTNEYRLNCTVEHSTGVAKRPKRKLPDDIFTKFERTTLNMVIARAYSAFKINQIPFVPDFYKVVSQDSLHALQG